MDSSCGASSVDVVDILIKRDCQEKEAQRLTDSSKSCDKLDEFDLNSLFKQVVITDKDDCANKDNGDDDKADPNDDQSHDENSNNEEDDDDKSSCTHSDQDVDCSFNSDDNSEYDYDSSENDDGSVYYEDYSDNRSDTASDYDDSGIEENGEADYGYNCTIEGCNCLDGIYDVYSYDNELIVNDDDDEENNVDEGYEEEDDIESQYYDNAPEMISAPEEIPRNETIGDDLDSDADVDVEEEEARHMRNNLLLVQMWYNLRRLGMERQDTAAEHSRTALGDENSIGTTEEKPS